MLRGLAALLLVITLFAAGACGGEEGASREEYERAVADTNEKVQAALDEVSTTGEELTSLEDAANTVDRAIRTVNGEAESLGRIDPPEEVEEEHEDLVGALEALADDLEDLSREIEQAEIEEVDPPEEESPELRELARRMRDLDFEAIDQARRALAAIEQEGYDVGGGR